MLRDLAGADLKHVLFEFHPEGSLATTYNTQGSDIGLAAGLCGMDILDPMMPHSLDRAAKSGIELEFRITPYPASHPNTYLATLTTGAGKILKARAESTGGGMIHVTGIQDSRVDLFGDEFVVVIQPRESEKLEIRTFPDRDSALTMLSAADSSVFLKSLIQPVLPIPSNKGANLPFNDLRELLDSPALLRRTLGDLGLAFESARSGFGETRMNDQMIRLIGVWKKSIAEGVAGTEYADRLMGAQVPLFMSRMNSGRLIQAGPLNRMMAYSTALMEVKSSMGVIIAAPTAGSCGGLPGTLIAMAEEANLPDDILVKGFWAAGLIGLFIAQGATFAAEVAGCQAETGAGAAMAAAGLVEMSGGTAQEALDAASVALQNVMGLVCDPVANRVEIPCLGRNAAEAGHALVAANLILGGIDPVIPLDESIVTMLEIGHAMPASLRCTALGGLAATPTAKRLERKLYDRNK